MFDEINLYWCKTANGRVINYRHKNNKKIIIIITNNKLISINNHAPTTKLNYWLLPRYTLYNIQNLNITFDPVESTTVR